MEQMKKLFYPISMMGLGLAIVVLGAVSFLHALDIRFVLHDDEPTVKEDEN